MTATIATCTVVVGADGRRCGADAVHEFTGTDGTTRYGECVEHSTAHVARRVGRDHVIGDRVEIRRYGRIYAGEIVRVTRTGRAFARFTYGNGVERTVQVGEGS